MSRSATFVEILIVSGTLVASAGASASLGAQHAELADLHWMAGCWEADLNGALWEEQWMEPRGGLMTMMSRTSRDGIVRAWEFGLVTRDSLGLVFRAFPSGQEPADFRAPTVAGRVVAFVNPDHDFPRRIRYRSNGPDRMVTSVYGEVDRGEPAFELDFGRVACPGGEPQPAERDAGGQGGHE
jgi:hypothetical protein